MTPDPARRTANGASRSRRVLAALAAVVFLAAGAEAAPTRAGEPSPDARFPDLAVLPPSALQIAIRPGGRKVLRFTSIVANIGRGPLQMAGVAKDGHANQGEKLDVRQQILEPDGTFTSRRTDAKMFWSGDGHNHWHVTDIQVATLQSLDDVEVGPYKKTGFCFIDSYRYTSNKPAHYTPANSVCQVRSANGRVPMGISVKWGDIYPASIAFQWVDITDVPNGKYRLKVFADPATEELPGGNFLESDETNNVGWVKIRIEGQNVKILDRSRRP